MNPVPLLSHFAINCTPTFLGFKSWNYYLNFDPNTCEILKFPLLGSHSGILLILLAVIDDLFRLIGLLAVGFIIYAGVKYS